MTGKVKRYKERPPRPAREITCAGCGDKFFVKTKGKTKYCIECKVDVLEERQKKNGKPKLLAK